MSHTPGPWEIMESANALVVMGANSKHVVIVPLFREHEWNKEEWEGLNLEEKNKVSIANTRLIAAAPELYEAIQTVDMALAGQKTSLEEWANISKTVRAALTKARGGLFDEAEYRHLLEDKKANKLSPQEEERLIQLYEEGEVDDIPSFFLRSEVEQKMDSLIEMIDDLTQRIKTLLEK